MTIAKDVDEERDADRAWNATAAAAYRCWFRTQQLHDETRAFAVRHASLGPRSRRISLNVRREDRDGRSGDD